MTIVKMLSTLDAVTRGINCINTDTMLSFMYPITRRMTNFFFGVNMSEEIYFYDIFLLIAGILHLLSGYKNKKNASI